jgi:periplasmic divalent cation tolerance protein
MTAHPNVLVVLCTCPDRGVAETLAHAAVEQGLAACVNIVPGVTSIYTWQGAVERADEVLLLAKIAGPSYAALETLWRSRHPYELPEVIALPITTGSADYLQWLREPGARAR